MNLRLSAIFWAVFPESRDLVARAHSADIDVLMTIRLIKAYFARCQGDPIPRKIESYFKRENDWKMTISQLEVTADDEAEDEILQADEDERDGWEGIDDLDGPTDLEDQEEDNEINGGPRR
jgi:hypothetical protein